MKRVIALILVLAAMLTLCACGATEKKVAGLWQRETIYLEHYGCDVDLYIAFADTGDYIEVLFDHDSGELLNMELGEWEIEKGKVEAVESGEPGTTVYKMVGNKLKNGKLKYTRIGDTEDFADLLG